MTTSGSDNGNFEDKARQYWSAWGDAMRHGQSASAAQPPPGPAGETPQDWRKAVDWWSQVLPTQAAPQAQEAINRFRTQAGDWYGTCSRSPRSSPGAIPLPARSPMPGGMPCKGRASS